MSKQNNLNDFLTDIADTLREKKGTSEPINAQDFSSEISNLPEPKTEVSCPVTPTTSSQTITPTNNQVFNEVNVEAVTSSIDANIQAENIKKDVSILGVTGTLESGAGITIPTVTNLTVTNGIASWTAPNLSDLTAYNPTVSYLVYCNDNFVEETTSTTSNVIAWLDTGDNEVSVIVKIKLDNIEDTEITSSVTTVSYTYSQLFEFSWSSSSDLVCLEYYDNKLYVFQAYYNDNYSRRRYVYDILSNTSTLLGTEIYSSSSKISVAFKLDNIIYHRYYSRIFSYDPSSDVFGEFKSSLDTTSTDAVLVGNCLYEFYPLVSNYTIIDIVSKTITSAICDTVIPVVNYGIAYYNRNIYFFGGATTSANYNTSIYKLNIDTNELTLLQTALPSVINSAKSILLGNKIYIMYGKTASSTYSRKIYMFDPILETITTLSTQTTNGDSSMSADPRMCAYNNKIYTIGTTNYRNKIKVLTKEVS